MNWLYEQQLPAVVISLSIVVASVILFVRSRRPVFLWGILVGLIVLGLGLWIESAVVTEEEEIEATLLAVASAMEEGDMETVSSYIDPSAVSSWRLKGISLTHFENRKFSDVNGSIERVDFNRSSNPISARVRVFGKATGQSLSNPPNEDPNFNWMGRVVFGMYKGEDGWIIQKVEGFAR
ncbi:MAG: hypothetical protein MPJ50_04945 [Pirellulales bacterium]|nr:hypothetical protein [Pirellulales bacterium]